MLAWNNSQMRVHIQPKRKSIKNKTGNHHSNFKISMYLIISPNPNSFFFPRGGVNISNPFFFFQPTPILIQSSYSFTFKTRIQINTINNIENMIVDFRNATINIFSGKLSRKKFKWKVISRNRRKTKRIILNFRTFSINLSYNY